MFKLTAKYGLLEPRGETAAGPVSQRERVVLYISVMRCCWALLNLTAHSLKNNRVLLVCAKLQYSM
jgi:hypothetical protein